MGGPILRPEQLNRTAFQKATAQTFDRQATFLQDLAQRVQAQGEVIADLCVARDEAKQHLGCSFWGRLRWLVTGK